MVRLVTASCLASVALAGVWAEEAFWKDAALLSGEHADPKLGFLSSTLGDHMVLQRAPHFAIVWGHTTPGATVTTLFAGNTFKTVAGVDGTWRQRLPPTPGSTKAYSLNFSSSAGETAELKDVLFGDVYVCGGQSNMQFSIPGDTDAEAESKLADQYPYIRLFTVGQGTKSTTPLKDLQTIEQTWSVASSQSIQGNGGFGYFSAVCWYFGRTISDKLAPKRDFPIGLISNNWGGTKVQQWSTPDVLKGCNSTPASYDGELYNAMINPYVVGPMVVSGFTWYQGESNVDDDHGAPEYACLFPSMIQAWRRAFKNPGAYFGFVQLSTWCADPEGIAQTREAQMAALQLPMVGYATNADHGAGCNIHPPQKRPAGERLGRSALALQYRQPLAWRSPSFVASAAALVPAQATTVAVTVAMRDVGAQGLVAVPQPYNMVPGLDCAALDAKAPNSCAWGGIEVEGAGWLNATASVAAGGKQMRLEAKLPASQSAPPKVLATSYGWGAVPMLTIYDQATGLPVLPWRREIRADSSELIV